MSLLKYSFAAAAAFLFITASSPVSFGQPGTLDTTFAGVGYRVDSFGQGGSEDLARATAIQSDGKIVAAGYAYNGANYDFALVRYNTDGSLDASFGSAGKAIRPVLAGDDQAYAIAIQADGKIVVAGSAYNATNADFALLRFNTNGTLDTSFGTGGKVTTAVLASTDIAYSVAIQADGRIVAAGLADNGTNQDFAVVRYNTNGSLDTTFDTDGKVTTAVGPSDDLANSVAIQSDGKIVAAGPSYSGADYDFALVRYNTDGSLDATFDTDGKLTTPILSSNDVAYSIAIQTDGKLVAGGYSFKGTNYDFALARYNPNGSLDTSFDTDGKVTTPVLASDDIAYSVAIQADGKIVAAGYAYNGSNQDFALVRYNTNGSLDGTFDTDGRVTTPVLAGTDNAYAVALQTDGKVVAAGSAYNGSNQDFALVRYTSAGALDPTFDTDGKVTTDVADGASIAPAIAIQPDGKIVAAGLVSNGSNYDFAVIRYNSSGALDGTFGTGGKVVTPVLASDDQANAVAIQPDGKIVVAGLAQTGSGLDIAVVRYNTNGTLDATFDGDGKVTTPVLASDDVANGVAIQTDGKIVVGGYAYNGSNQDFALVRYNTNGSLDTAFDTDGKVTTPILASQDAANSIAIQTDGKIVAAGYAYNGTNQDFALARFNTDGSLDPTFDTDGKLTTPILSGQDVANSVVIQPNGKIVAGGFANNGTNQDFALARYNTDGSLDAGFDTDGKVTTAVGSGDDQAAAVAIKSDGKIVAAGTASNGANIDFALVRYTSTGGLDSGFGTGGKATADIEQDFVAAMVLDSSGRPVVAGQMAGQFMVARFRSDLITTAAAVTVSGRVVAADGTGIRNARVILSDGAGNRLTALTNAFGFYQFDAVQAGSTYVIGAQVRGHIFTPRVVTIVDAVSGLDITALP